MNLDLMYSEVLAKLIDQDLSSRKFCPIYIPSKGRASLCTTPKTLDALGLPYKLVVEPQDYESYLEFFSTEQVVPMPENDMGIDIA